jgi:hypothetical protein
MGIYVGEYLSKLVFLIFLMQREHIIIFKNEIYKSKLGFVNFES